jgi:hypothetical protein
LGGRNWLWLLVHVQPVNVRVKESVTGMKLAAARSATMLFSGSKNSSLAEELAIGL